MVMQSRFLALASWLICIANVCTAQTIEQQPQFSAEQIEFFEVHVRPVLVAHCFDCHSTDAPELEAGLYVDSRQAILHGGESGAAIVPGKPDESLLIASVKYDSYEMPPDRKLDQRHIDALVKWVEMGVPWPQVTSSPGTPVPTGTDWQTFDWATARREHWAWQRVERPAVPSMDAQSPAENHPIDRFVSAQRSAAGLTPSAPAPAAVLVHRICIDLIGIPPTPDQTQAFIDAATIDRQLAIERLLEELLDSPAYGQRWGRHWLDVARYSDGHGGFLDNQNLSEAWRYRDWVVDAFNRDLPIDRFLWLQIAGDTTGDFTDGIATGFFALGPTYTSDGGDPDSVAQAQGETLDDRIDTLTRGLLGITGSCARCHDHKFDPIPQQDYYSLAGVFRNTATHAQPLVPQDVVQRFNEHQQAVGELNQQITQLDKKIKDENRSASPEERQHREQWQQRLEALKANAPPPFATTHALHDTGNSDMKVALRGNLRKTGELAPRRFPRLLSDTVEPSFREGSGRVGLADAIVDPSNPLTARVFVNRVWMHHFGAGIVRTASNFGALGEPPTHPQLLDWLTAEFVANGWSLKSLHRQIMTSATYQLSSEFDAHSFASDGDNRLLWRFSPRRMDVEAWRDSLLSVTDELDLAAGGPPVDDITASPRRTLYAKVSRNGDVFASDRFLRRFDFPLMRATVAQRPHSIVPQQFLFLLNSPFMVQRAQAFAKRLHSTADSDQQRIELAYAWLYHRQPQAAELQLGLQYLHGAPHHDGLSAWDRYAQVLLSSNEFMYVR